MIRIRPFQSADTETVLSWCTDEETWSGWTAGVLGDYPLTAEKFAATAAARRFTALDGEEPVGFFILRRPDGAAHALRIGFVIVDPRKRNRGIGKEMVRLGAALAFREPGVGKVTLGVMEDNLPARACYASAGFRETGVREAYPIRGRTLFAVEMALTREDG